MTINEDLDDSLIYQARIADIDLGDGSNELHPPSPYILYGSVKDSSGSVISDVEVQVEHQDTGETLSIPSDDNGYYELNFGNLVNQGYSVGDTFTVSAGDTSKNFTVEGEWGRRIDLTAEYSSDGDITLDQDEYRVEDSVAITVTDGDLTEENITVTVESTTESTGESVDLGSTDTQGEYTGDISISETDSDGILQVSDGDNITAHYEDADTGDGTSETKTDTAIVDGSVASPSDLTVEWDGIQNKTFVDENFDGSFPPANWTSKGTDGSTQWEQSSTSDAGGTSPEAKFNYGDSGVESQWRLYAGPFDTSGMSELNLQWDNYLNSYGSGCEIQVETSSNATTWQDTSWVHTTDTDIGPGIETLTVNTSDVGSSSFYVSFTVDGDSYDLDDWNVDNVLLTGTSSGGSTEDNLLDWTLSPDDGAGEDDVVQYNIYRSENESGPWDDSNYLTSVSAGTNSYRDVDKGEPDGINWWYVVRAEDDVGNEDSNTNAVPEIEESNKTAPDAPTNPSPADGATGVSTSPTLSVDVSDPDGDTMDVSFYNASDDNLIGTDTGVTDGGTASVTWSGLAYDTTHNWYTVADDGNTTTTSDTWSFTTQTQNYTLTIDSTGGGSVTQPGEGTFEYNSGTVIDIEAVADTGYHFVEWTGDNETIGDSTANATTIEMLDNYSITANFAINTYTLDVSSTAGGNVTHPGEGTFTYDHGTEVDLEAIADEGYQFVEWTGDNGTIGDVTANQTSITMEDNYTITAEFAETQVDNVEITPGSDQVITAGDELIFDAAAYDLDGDLITDDRVDFTWQTATRGVFNKRRAEDYEVTATYDGVTSGITTVTVDPASADRIEISPEEDTAAAGTTITYTATAYDAYENEIGDVSGDTTWSIEDGAGGSWTGSEYTSEVSGDWTVTGGYDGLTDTALLTVEPGAVDTVELTPSEDQTIVSGEKIEFSAVAYDAHGNLIASNVQAFDWQNASRGVFYYDMPGEYEVTATYDGVESEVTTVIVEEEETMGNNSIETLDDPLEESVLDMRRAIGTEERKYLSSLL
ncbi:MAG: InlB B-repeat-containing protein [Thermoplasmata archaeon]